MSNRELVYSARGSSLSNLKSVRIYVKRLLTQFDEGLLNATQFNAKLSALKLIEDCLVKDQDNKIKRLEKQLAEITEGLKNG